MTTPPTKSPTTSPTASPTSTQNITCNDIGGLIAFQDMCIPCEPGFYSPPQITQCLPCASNTIAPARQSSACISCGTNNFVTDDTRTHCLCKEGYYRDDYSEDQTKQWTTCHHCISGSDCRSFGQQLSLLKTLPGYYRANITHITYSKCEFPHRCLGGFNSQCKAGFDGFDCIQCTDGSIRNGNYCWECPPSHAETGVYILFISITILIIFSLIVYSVNHTARKQLNIAKERESSVHTISEFIKFDRKLRSERKITSDGISPPFATTMIKAKLMILDFQVIAKISTLWSREWSPGFTWVAQSLDIFNLDLVSSTAVMCIQHISFYTKITLSLLLPIVVFSLIFFMYVLPQHYCREKIRFKVGSQKWASRKRTKRKTIRLMIFFVYILYIPITTSMFMIYNCVELDGIYHLFLDFQTECYTEQWLQWNMVVGILGSMLVLGIPAILQYIVLVKKENLRDPLTLATYDIIYNAYHTNMVWVDGIELLLRWLLTSLIPLLSVDIQPYVACAFLTLFIGFILMYKPYRSPIIDRLHLLSYTNLIIISIATITYQNWKQIYVWERIVMDIFLISSILMVFVTFFSHELSGGRTLWQYITMLVCGESYVIQNEKMKKDRKNVDVLLSLSDNQEISNDANVSWPRLQRRNILENEYLLEMMTDGHIDQKFQMTNEEHCSLNPLHPEVRKRLIQQQKTQFHRETEGYLENENVSFASI